MPANGWAAWRNRVAASRGFQAWAARFPLTRRTVRREGEAMFDLIAGFVHSQVLRAVIELRLLHLLERPRTTAQIAESCDLTPDRAAILLTASQALGLIEDTRHGWRTSRRGAALLGVPGLESMIAHHDVLYRDLADPVALLRGHGGELAQFWPYVFGAGQGDPAIAARYSTLMADSQALVAEDTLAVIDLRGTRHLLDIGGGTGTFLTHVATAYPAMTLTLMDLPQVMPAARHRLADTAIGLYPGSFRDDPLPPGADAVSLIRVLYDHRDDIVLALLRKVHNALPKGGRLIVSEPMTGNRAGDTYFALYCMAMGTGTARAPGRIADLMAQAGFADVWHPRSNRPFVTTVLTATV